jgi:hypothetical protein
MRLRTPLPCLIIPSAARTIGRIGKEEGEPFKPPDGGAGERYMVMVPDDDEAPVVVYRQDESGYLVTGLMKRADYKTYLRPEPPAAFLDTPAGQAALLAGGALLVLYLLNRKQGGSAGSAGTAA